MPREPATKKFVRPPSLTERRAREQSSDISDIIRLPGGGFTWEELRPLMAAGTLRPLGPAVTALPPHGVFVTDHFGATRAIVALVLAHTRDGGPAAMRSEDGSREIEGLLYAALMKIGRAELATLDASLLHIRPPHADARRARALVVEKREALRSARDLLVASSELLTDAIERDSNLFEVSNDRGDASDKKKKKKKKPQGDGPTGGDLALDALSQVDALIDSIKDMVEKLEPDEGDEDKVAALIAKIAAIMLTGGKAALAAALTELFKELDVDAKPADTHVKKGDDGSIMVFFRVRKGCLFIFDWAVEDDYIFIKKGGKSDGFEWAAGKSAKELHDQAMKADAAAGGKASGGTPAASPPGSAPIPAPQPPVQPPTPSGPHWY